MKKIKYYGNWNANNVSSYNDGYEFTNLKDAKKRMRNICEGNVFAGSTGNWNIKDANGSHIAWGSIHR